ncbi:MAG: glycine--tRNA ligase [Metamycoplasmataceae bacterium]
MFSSKDKDFKKITSHLKNSGFVFQSSLIYGGFANSWDYGFFGLLIKNNIQQLWWKNFINFEINNVAIDSKILLNPNVWKASGHIDNFTDLLIENKINHKRYRADHIYEEITKKNSSNLSKEELEQFLKKEVSFYDNEKTDWDEIKNFNLLFETYQGIIEDKKTKTFLRPETAQGIFINFSNVQRALRLKLPFGIGQVGKSFRNEVTPGNFIFRTREFEQMELEFFTFPEEADKWYKYYVDKSFKFISSFLNNKNDVRIRVHDKEELAHYSGGTTDIEFLFPFGWGEVMGISNRKDFDLKSHNLLAEEKQFYFDPNSNEKIIPYVIEPSVGLDRLLLVCLVDAYVEEKVDENDTRIVLKLAKELCPYKFAILPLVKKLSPEATEIYHSLIKKNISVTFDESGSIGKRYRRQDSIGTFYCITFDYQSLEDKMVTIRTRDDMQQKRIKITEIENYL